MNCMAARRVVVPQHAHLRQALHHAEIATLGGETMGTTWSVRLVMPRGFCLEPKRSIARALSKVVAQMSAWEADSDLSRFNRAAADSAHTLPEDFGFVLDYALSAAAETGGAYDPSIGTLTVAWGFGPEGNTGSRPDAESIGKALLRSGWRRLSFAPATRTLIQPGGIALDLCAVAKGFAVDHLAEILRAYGLRNFLVEIGGELRGEGCKPDGNPWWVQVEAPRAAMSKHVPETLIALHDLAVATSGDYRRYFDSGRVRYAHTIDPRTGHPVANGVLSVTVLAPSCMEADAISTALMVMGEQHGIAFAEARGIAALFVMEDNGALRQSFTPAFSAMTE